MVHCPHCGHGVAENSLMFKFVRYVCVECGGRYTLELDPAGWKAVATEMPQRPVEQASGALELIRQ